MNPTYDAVIILSFGGPEGMDDVVPFLDNVLRGKNVLEERKREVAKHYEMFGGVSPINQQNRELQKKLQAKLKEVGIDLPVFWGNRNWKPYIKDALTQMKDAGIKHALAYVTSAYGSYSGCRQYIENIEQARSKIGPDAPQVQKLRLFFDHPKFIQAHVDQIQKEWEKIPSDKRSKACLVFTAHSIPMWMSESSPYQEQLLATCEAIVGKLNIPNWKLVYQSRSGPPNVPWLGPDIGEYLEELAEKKVEHVVVSPVGFVSDHMEVIYDLDVEVKKKAKESKILFQRAATPGNSTLMIDMIVDLIKEQIQGSPAAVCKPDCCKPRSK